MKHKKLFIVIAVVVALAIAASIAFAWWTTSASIGGNSVGSDTATLAAGGSVSVSHLIPQLPPVADPTGGLSDSTYPSVSYIYVQNTGSTPLMFYAYLANGSGDTVLLPYVHVRIWLNPANNNSPWTNTFNNTGNYLVFEGTLDLLWNNAVVAGKYYLGSTSGHNGAGVQTPIAPGQLGVYKIAVWLDSTAGNDTQGKTIYFDINFNGEQVEQFQLTNDWSAI
jgi:hypothetical protein